MTMAYNTDRASYNNDFTLGTWKTVFEETFDAPSNWITCETIDKEITVKNESNVKASVRIRLEEQWLKKDGTQLPIVSEDSGYQLAQINFLENSGWTYHADGYYYYEEKFVMIEENGEIKLSIAEYVGDENLNITVEDANVKIEVVNKSVDYETVTYKLKVTNKTDKYIVFADNTSVKEIELYVNGEMRANNNDHFAYFYAVPNTTVTQELQFNKFYDEKAEDEKITLKNVRIFNDYDWKVGTTQENLDNAVEVYTIEVPLQ